MPRATASRPSTRRAGDSGTRDAIRIAAGRQFAENGYQRTSLRSIAREAAVDPALVAHFFGTKQRLFVEVVELPFEPETAFPAILAGERDGVGGRVAMFLLAVLEDHGARRRLVALVRAAATEPEAAEMVRDLVTRRVVGPIVTALGVDDANLRASLAGSQVVGLLMARYVIAIEPLASLPSAALAALIAPTLQRYLVGSLDSPRTTRAADGRRLRQP